MSGPAQMHRPSQGVAAPLFASGISSPSGGKVMCIIRYHWLNRTLVLQSLSLVLLTGGGALAQETRSTILGTVKDQTGAAVAGAIIEVTNTETNTTAKLSTNSSGYFEAPYLLPGT